MKQTILTPEERAAKVLKLPQWAQDYITTIERQRETAVSKLNDYVDNQTPSDISYREYLSTGENRTDQFKTRFVQSHEIGIHAHGVYMTVRVGQGTHGESCLHVSYGGGERETLSGDECALIPTSYQQFKLVAHKNMRTR